MQVDSEVLSVLSRATTNGTALTLVGQLDRKLYERTNKVLEAAGGKWDRRAKAHVFADDAATRMEQILLTGDIVIPKDEFNYFPTPPDVVDRLMELADVRPGMLVLEPSAGQGAIANACRTAGGEVTCIELMPANAQALRDQRHSVSERDFLTMQPSPLMDRVVMNPPFARQADIKHVLHAMRFLRDGGRLVSVMSASVTFRENRLTQDFRALVSSRSGSIEELPEGAFKSSGTMVRTVIVTIPA